MSGVVLFSFISVIALFIIGLMVKTYTKIRLCAMCVSVSVTWIGLLVLSWIDRDIPDVLIALFMGQSIIGVLYLFEKKVAEKYHIFRMPFLLSLTYIAYTMIVGTKEYWMTIIFLLIIWIMSIFLYVVQKKGKLKDMVAHIIACCRDW